MPTGTVTASTLRVRESADPAASTIGYVHKDEVVDIQDQQDGWLRIIAEDQGQMLRGWASAQYIAVTAAAPDPIVDLAAAAAPAAAPEAAPAAAPAGLPVADDAANPVTVHDGHAFGPGDVKFATAYKFGFFTTGLTPAYDWIAGHAQLLSLSSSVQRVVQAVSRNEGKLEAVNNWDSAFMSFGLFQWTAGAADGPGELAGLLAKLKAQSPAAFQDLFGAFGLDAQIAGGGVLKNGFLVIGADPLNARSKKQVLRGAEWAYRFWRAGHDDSVRKCQCELAADRIAALSALSAAGHSPTAWLTSEHGVALLLDEHVNRPGHVVTTLEDALTRPGAPQDPAGMDDAAEQALIAAYVAARNATDMTDPEARAAQIAAAAADGNLGAARGSFQP